MIIDHPNPTRRRIAHWVGMVSGMQCTIFSGYRLSEMIITAPNDNAEMQAVWLFLVLFGFLVYGICSVDMAFWAAEEGAKIAASEMAAIRTELQKRREREYFLKFQKPGLN